MYVVLLILMALCLFAIFFIVDKCAKYSVDLKFEKRYRDLDKTINGK